MLHVDVDVPYVESFMGLTSSLRLGVEHGGDLHGHGESPSLIGKSCFFFVVIFHSKLFDSQRVLVQNRRFEI